MTQIGQETFPPNGKVLVVGMSVGTQPVRYAKRILSYNSWELMSWSKLPSGVEGICVSIKAQRGVHDKIAELAKQAGLTRVEKEHSSETLQHRLKFWFGSGQPGEGTEEESTIPVQVVGEARVLVKRLKPLTGQPRKHFSVAKLKELATSIKMIGQQDPVKVVKLEGDLDYDYELIDGERRFKAVVMLGQPEIWAVVCIVKNKDDQFMRSFAANFAREGHTPLDTARAINKMLTFAEFKEMSKTQAVKRVAALAGKSDQWALMHLRLLKLPDEVQKMLEPDGDDKYKLPLTVGMYLSTIDDRDIQLKVCEAVVRGNLTMNAAMNVARKLAHQAGKTIGSPERSPRKDYNILVNFLRKTVGGATVLLDMPRSLDELFTHRRLKDRKDQMLEVEKAIQLLQRIHEALKVRVEVKN